MPPTCQAESVCLVEFDKDSNTGLEIYDSQLYLFIGADKGALFRITVDKISGSLSDVRLRCIGQRKVRCFRHYVKGTNALIALSSKPWICYIHAGKYLNTPLTYDTLDYTSYFSADICQEGIISSSDKTLRFLIPKNYGEIFNQKVIPTRYTPRKILINKDNKNLIILESDHRSYPYEEKTKIKEELYADYGEEGKVAMKLNEA